MHSLGGAWVSMRLTVPWLCLCVVLTGSADTPELSERDVLNAADYSGGRVAPGEIVVLFPSNAGPAMLVGAQRDAEGKVTTMLGETRVFFDDIAAPMVYSMRGRVSAIVPYAVSNRRMTQVVVEYQGVRSVPVTLAVVESAPGLFTLDSSGKGQAAMLNEAGCCNSARNPAARGTIAVLYATGEGETNPPGIDGSISAYPRIADYPVPKLPVRVTVGGESAEIIYAGEAPHMAEGALQVNFRVPAKAPLGDAVPVVLTVGSAHSPDGVTMGVRSPVQQILVIEPEPAIRNWFKKVLTGAGYEIFMAPSDRQALVQADRHPIDLVISHLGMPDGERLETIRRMQKRRSQLKIIVTARTPGPRTLRAADLLGAQAVLTQPLTSQAVLRRVRDACGARPVPYVGAQDVPPLPLSGNIPR
jgi:uncharacterized protein (TIGR03437 family)